MNENVADTLPVQDDISNTGPSEQELLDAVMANSPIMEEIDAPPLPEEEDQVQDPVDAEDDEDPVEEEAVSEDDGEGVEELEEELEDGDDAEEASTDVPDVYTADDLDLDAKLMVKIDGEEQEVSFGDLIKGYQTDSHLSKKGREISEAQKAFETERDQKLKEADELVQASSVALYQTEQGYAKEYQDFEAKINKAREDGDTFELSELKDKRELVQKKYWEARREREGLLENLQKQNQKRQEEAFNEQLQNFHKEIPGLIPDFDEKVAMSIRDFAVERGISEGLLDSIVDPNIVKFIDDFRRREQGISKGTAKRKALPAKKAVPAKKSKAPAKKKQDAEKMVKARAFREDASPEDQMAFLRQHASKSLS